MSNDYQVSQETDAMKRLSKSRTGLFSKEDNDKECSECGGEPYPKVWWRTVSNSPDYNTASPDITNMNEELTSEIVEKIIPIIEKYSAQAQQEAVQRERERLQPAVEIAEAIADLRAFDKETGYIWQHWIDQAQKVIEALQTTEKKEEECQLE